MGRSRTWPAVIAFAILCLPFAVDAGQTGGFREDCPSAEEPLRELAEDLREKVWVNNGGNQRWTALSLRPTTLQELSESLRYLDQALPPEAEIKAGGSRHSWSPVAQSSGVYVEPEGFRFVERVDEKELKESVAASNLFRIGSGTTLREINQTLWDREGQALPSLGGYDGQTLGGALATGTHGSILKHGPIGDIVQGVDLVTANGRRIRIEPTDGMTDPERFQATHPDWTLVQADETFRASQIHLGMLGVVHSYVVKTVARHHMTEVRTATTGRAAQEVLAGENVYNIMETDRPAAGNARQFSGHPERSRYLDVLWSPYTDAVIVTSRHPVDDERQRAFEQHEPASFANPRKANPLRRFFVKPEHSRPNEMLSHHAEKTVVGLTEKIGKYFPKLLPGMISRGMKAMADAEHTNRSYNVFKNEDRHVRVATQGAEISVPIRGDAYLRAMEVFRRVTAEFAQNRELVTFPILIRFVKATEASLGHPEDVAMFDLSFAGESESTQEMSRRFVSALYQALSAELGTANVRMHWGKLLPECLSREQIAQAYPDLENFLRVREELDPRGRFTNRWQRRLLLDPAPPPAPPR